MRYRKLGHTDIKVSEICLGTMTWGDQNTEAEAHEQLDYALDHGVNFIDTAEMYPVPPSGETCYRTEEYIGNWIKSRGNRDKFILTSKIAGPVAPTHPMTWLRNGETRFNKDHLTRALDASLGRLQTDYLDLYQLHWPDRNVPKFGGREYIPANEDITPIEETLSVLNDFVKQGKIRSIGLSNETAWGVMKFLSTAEKMGMERIVSVQNSYSLLNRTYELSLSEVSDRENIGLLAYSPLSFGVLSGKYLHGAMPADSRNALYDRYRRSLAPKAVAATEKYVALAKAHDLNPAQLAIKFVCDRPFVTSAIIGATKMTQLKTNIDATNIELSEDILTSIAEIHDNNRNPVA